ncbi:thiosulfate oxidation carrier protein SoxY [Pararhodobacter sp.]|uniref:thiosulfate oxidation carrier protein SoxY n=1 Tax=Pararhodobacter sp. TaxID=2127056 RepID=UPI002AFF79BA|nr:thiosulfate oxidation carrier protein SoxY [Pararhodobacter sp.]
MLTRRDTLAIGLGASALALLPVTASALTVEEAIAAFTGGAEMAETGVTITAPEIAENGNTVPIAISAPGASEITIIATGNPTPNVGRFMFGEAAGAAMIATRIRLGRTQDVVAIAKMADGTFASTRVEIKVTIGGCGG